MISSTAPIAEFEKAKELIFAAQNILIISHRNPDGDTIGSNLALRAALEKLGKNIVSSCVDDLPKNSVFLKGSEKFVQDFDLSVFDLIITVDCGGYKLVGFHTKKPEILSGKTPVINIDHHQSNEYFGDINIVMTDAPAACSVVYQIINYFDWEITKDMATALLHGLYFDTGSFMHSNTDALTLRIASRLKTLGADHEACVKHQFNSSSLEQLRLWGYALSRASLNKKHAVVSTLTKEDFEKSNTSPGDISGLVNYLNYVPESKLSVLLTEDQDGNIKASMRTQGEEVDLSAIAELFGGGGHKKAAGFTIPGHITQKLVWEVV